MISALPPKTDIGAQSWNVRFVPKADIGGAAKERLFNHLIGAGKERGRDFEAERFGRF